MCTEKLNFLELKKNPTEFPCVKLSTPTEAADFIRQFYSDDIGIFESFFVLLLNHSNKTIGYAKISQGGITGTVVDFRIIAKYAIESLSTSIILAHNHPSGTLHPSDQDIKITEKIQNGLALFDIKVSDHIILTEDGYYSFAKENRL